ncbi:MAG TPA: hypothetical protein VFN18_06490 [Solirubrobacterales bacterium]|nr:hypothetical protein [Solirubrobacterales bacterium]
MHDKATSASAGDYEESVLRHVLIQQPTILRLCDLIRELAKDPRDFAHRDGVKRAVRDLTKVGLLHRQGECVLPTPAAVYVRGMEIG